MVAKGHDFQRVGLVVVLNPDAQILSPSVQRKNVFFHTHASRRACRASRVTAVRCLSRQDSLRSRCLPHWRHRIIQCSQTRHWKSAAKVDVFPLLYQALLTVEAEHLSKLLVLEQAATIASQLAPPEVFIYDPVPMALVKVMNRERAQLLVESSVRPILHRFLTVWNQALKTVPRSSSASVCFGGRSFGNLI